MYLGLLSVDPDWAKDKPTLVNRRYIAGTALLVLAMFILLFPIIQIGLALILPTPFEYRDIPFRVCAPTSTSAECLPLKESDVFYPQDVVPFVVDRCATDIFARSAQLPYVLSRNLVNDRSGVRIIMPSLSTTLPSSGCETSITVAHQLPESVAPGVYYLEGVATVYGRFKTVNSYFRTQTFVVAKPDN